MLKRTEEPKQLDDAVMRAYISLSFENVGPDEYMKKLEVVERLEALTRKKPPRWRVSPDTAATIFTNLASILIIVGYEHTHVITSKAYGTFIRRDGLNLKG